MGFNWNSYAYEKEKHVSMKHACKCDINFFLFLKMCLKIVFENQ